MSSMLRVSAPGLTQFHDGTGGWDSVSSICGAGPDGLGTVPVTCMVYPVNGATHVNGTGATLLINDIPRAFNPPQTPGLQNPLQLRFNIGGDATAETAGDWNTVKITVQDNNSILTTFMFYYYKTTTLTATTTRPLLPPIAGTPAKRPVKKSAKGKP